MYYDDRNFAANVPELLVAAARDCKDEPRRWGLCDNPKKSTFTAKTARQRRELARLVQGDPEYADVVKDIIKIVGTKSALAPVLGHRPRCQGAEDEGESESSSSWGHPW